MSRIIDADALDAELDRELKENVSDTLLGIGNRNGLRTARAILWRQPTARLTPCDVCYLHGRDDSRCLSCPAGPI